MHTNTLGQCFHFLNTHEIDLNMCQIIYYQSGNSIYSTTQREKERMWYTKSARWLAYAIQSTWIECRKLFLNVKTFEST